MKEAICESGWLDIVRRQEEAVRPAAFTREDALEIGLAIVKLAKEVYCTDAAVSILEDGMEVFGFKMGSCGLENEWWMQRKLATTRLTGVSSIRAYLEIEQGLREKLPNDNTFVACGGCVPLYVSGVPRVHILVSGMRHYEDHQLIFDVLSDHYSLTLDTLIKP